MEKVIKAVLGVRDFIRGNPNADAPSLTFPASQKDGNLQPGLLIISGGGYFSRDVRNEAMPSLRFFRDLGFKVFLLNYRVSPYKHPSALEDAMRGIQYLREHASRYSLDTGKIGVIGYSAGGHVAAMLAGSNDEKSTVDFQILCYPIIDLLRKSVVMEFVRKMVLDEQGDSRGAPLDASLLVKPHHPKTFIWHSKKDKIIHFQHSLEYVGALRRNQVEYESHFFEDGGHGLGLARSPKLKNKAVYHWTAHLRSWLEKHCIIEGVADVGFERTLSLETIRL